MVQVVGDVLAVEEKDIDVLIIHLLVHFYCLH